VNGSDYESNLFNDNQEDISIDISCKILLSRKYTTCTCKNISTSSFIKVLMIISFNKLNAKLYKFLTLANNDFTILSPFFNNREVIGTNSYVTKYEPSFITTLSSAHRENMYCLSFYRDYAAISASSNMDIGLSYITLSSTVGRDSYTLCSVDR